MKKNQFQEYCEQVKKILQEYKIVCQQANINDEGLSAAVERKAKPFVEGNFTLAIVGKMSAGKSTFINAFLGKNILPTGHFQTTAILTKIEHAEEKSIEIVYGNNKGISIRGDIESQLKNYVAIEEKYSDLPLNYINKKIIDGVNKEDFFRSDNIKDMEGISGIEVDRNLLEEYITEHPKSKIAKEVTVRCPFPEDCIGWRIVDTPGVGAVGGFDLETTKFLTAKLENGDYNVDAIIFLHKGTDNIEDKDTNNFVNDTFDKLSDEAKKRVFFVITKCADGNFRRHKKEIMSKAKKFFVEKTGIKEDRLLAIDSLMEILHRYITKENKDALSLRKSKDVPDSSWDDKTWEECRELLSNIKNSLEDDDINVNNENILERAQEWSGFDKFRKVLNEFVKTEKTNAFEGLLETINKDIKQAIDGKENDKKNLQEGVERMEGQINELESARLEMQEELSNIGKDFSQEKVSERFKFVEDIIENHIEKADSEDKIVTDTINLYNIADKVKLALFDEMKSRIEAYVEVRKSEVFFKMPDLDKIKVEATKQATYSKDIIVERSVPGGCCNKNKKEKYIVHKKGSVNAERALRIFRNDAVHHIRKAATEFKEKVQEEVDSYISKVGAAQKEKIGEQQRHLEELKAKYKASSSAELRNMISATENDISELKDFKSSLKEY